MPSVLETFFYVFDTNASDAKKDFEGVERAADEMSDSLEDASESTAKMDTSMSTLIKTAGAAVVSFIGVSAASKAIDFSQQIDQLGKTAELWGLNIEQVGAWGEVNARFGGSQDAMLSTIESLNTGLNEIALTGEGSLLPFLNLFGISAISAGGKARDAFSILPELADQFQNLTSREAATLGQQLGLDESTIRMLQAGRHEIDQMIDRQRELGVVTKEEAKIAADFNDSLSDTGQIFSTLARRLLTAALPAITAFLDGFTELMVFMNNNEAFIQGFFIGLSGIITAVYLPAIIKAAAATIIAVSPFLLIAAAAAAAAAAVGLLFDDIKHWVDGNESLIGRLLGSWENYKESFRAIVEDIKGFFNDMFDVAKDKIEPIARFFGFGGKDDSGPANAQRALSEASGTPIGALTSSAITNSTVNRGNSTVQVEIGTIQTQATNANELAQELGNSLKEQMRATVNSFDDGTKS